MLMPTFGYIRSTKHGMNRVTFMSRSATGRMRHRLRKCQTGVEAVKSLFRRSHTRRDDIPEEPPQPPKQNKIIEKDEGEYVDYEELKD